MDNPTSQSFFHRHEFLIRRLHSLSGLIPVGAFMCVHLLVNASINNGAATFQDAVYQIHSLGPLLTIVEWTFIFIPILFHAVYGVVIIAGGLPNSGSYPYRNNYRFTLQRVSGMLAFAFIVVHVFHMHGWVHFEGWLKVIEGKGALFAPYNAASSLGEAMRGFGWQIFYFVGVFACVYHLANGLWTMGITWGLWVSPQAQQRANIACLVVGLGLSAIAFGAWYGAIANTSDESVQENLAKENQMYEFRVESGMLDPEQSAHKRSDGHAEPGESETAENDDDPNASSTEAE